MHILFYSCGSLEGIDLVGVLPGQVDIGSADMAWEHTDKVNALKGAAGIK